MTVHYTAVRKFTRYSIDVRAKLGVGNREFTVRTLDVSEGGIGILSPSELPAGEPITIEFVFPTMQDVFHAGLQGQSKNGFRFGFQFVGLDEKNMALLRKYERRWGIRAE
jgi:c-di-GMP-binding flagellar brake protein YcgR